MTTKSTNSKAIPRNRSLYVHEKGRQSSSSKIQREDRSKDYFQMRPKSGLLHRHGEKRPLPAFGVNQYAESALKEVVKEECVEISSENVFDDDLYSSSHPGVDNKVTDLKRGTEHAFESSNVLKTKFFATSGSTFGLERASSPENIESRVRYWSLIHNAFEASAVTPLSSVWIENAYSFVPEVLGHRFLNILMECTKVSFV